MPSFLDRGPLARPHLQKNLFRPQGWVGKKRGRVGGEQTQVTLSVTSFLLWKFTPCDAPRQAQPYSPPLLGTRRGPKPDRPQCLPQSPSAKAFPPCWGSLLPALATSPGRSWEAKGLRG